MFYRILYIKILHLVMMMTKGKLKYGFVQDTSSKTLSHDILRFNPRCRSKGQEHHTYISKRSSNHQCFLPVYVRCAIFNPISSSFVSETIRFHDTMVRNTFILMVYSHASITKWRERIRRQVCNFQRPIKSCSCLKNGCFRIRLELSQCA